MAVAVYKMKYDRQGREFVLSAAETDTKEYYDDWNAVNAGWGVATRLRDRLRFVDEEQRRSSGNWLDRLRMDTLPPKRRPVAVPPFFHIVNEADGFYDVYGAREKVVNFSAGFLQRIGILPVEYADLPLPEVYKEDWGLPNRVAVTRARLEDCVRFAQEACKVAARDSLIAKEQPGIVKLWMEA